MIFENRPDKATELAEVIKNWAVEKTDSGDIEVVLEKCGKSYIRFKTPYISSIMPESDAPDSGCYYT
ncbi:MAG: hypothetical protein ACI4E1_08430 [Lachnospira sp.]